MNTPILFTNQKTVATVGPIPTSAEFVRLRQGRAGDLLNGLQASPLLGQMLDDMRQEGGMGDEEILQCVLFALDNHMFAMECVAEFARIGWIDVVPGTN